MYRKQHPKSERAEVNLRPVQVFRPDIHPWSDLSEAARGVLVQEALKVIDIERWLAG